VDGTIMVFAEDSVEIPDQFTRVYALCHSRSAQYTRSETHHHNGKCSSLEGIWFHGRYVPSLLFEQVREL
jgi:hypothetical protein